MLGYFEDSLLKIENSTYKNNTNGVLNLIEYDSAGKFLKLKAMLTNKGNGGIVALSKMVYQQKNNSFSLVSSIYDTVLCDTIEIIANLENQRVVVAQYDSSVKLRWLNQGLNAEVIFITAIKAGYSGET
jgi:hypothetical protein